MTRKRFVPSFTLAILMMLVIPFAAMAQGGPPPPVPVDQTEEIAALRSQYEDLSPDEVTAAGFEIISDCVSIPNVGGMGYHAVNFPVYQEQFNAGTMDPEYPPVLLLDKDKKVVGLEWEAKDLGQGTLTLFDQDVEVQPGHEGVEEPHFMMHLYFRPDDQVLLLSSASAPPFDPLVECPAGMPPAGGGGTSRPDPSPLLPTAALAVAALALTGLALRRAGPRRS
ncbi:MAG: hypothetical protein WKH64_06415 [Chloroflexia bacterium]